MILVRMEEAGGRTICTLWDEGKVYPFDLENGFMRPGLAAALSVSAKVSIEKGKAMKKSFLFYWQALSCFRGRRPPLL